MTPPPPVSNDPYSSYSPYGNASAPPPPTPYSAPSYGPGPQSYPPPAPNYNNYAPTKKKGSPWLIIGIVVIVVVLLACGGGAWGIAKLLGVGSSDGQAKSEPKGINFTYSSVKFTVTSLQQAKTFEDDDSIYSSSGTTRYVRVNLHEEYPSGDHMYFSISYYSGFKLVMPDGKSVKTQGEKYYTSGSAGQKRDNWLDFKVSQAVEDLSQLVLKVGKEGSGEMILSIPLKDNPDLSKYQDKAIAPNQQFSYADMNWTLKSATQSFSLGGEQVQDGNVFITVSLVANNPTNYKYYMASFVALIGPDKNPTPPDTLASDLDNFYIIQAHSTNITGTAVFEVKLSPTGQYMLYFVEGEDNAWPSKQVPLQFPV